MLKFLGSQHSCIHTKIHCVFQKQKEIDAQIEKEKTETEADFQLKKLQLKLNARVRDSQGPSERHPGPDFRNFLK